MSKVSIIIPSRNEPYLTRTIEDLIKKAGGEIEIIAIVDESYPDKLVDGVKYLHPDKPEGMRRGINKAVKEAAGQYIMKVDAHCLFDKDFDLKLKASCKENTVVVPRRYYLDEDKWERTDQFHDYGYFIYPRKFRPMTLVGWEWLERDKSKKLIDENLSFQGSCWFMTKKHFEKLGLLEVEGYRGLPQQEATEISLKTWYSGGKVLVNKKTWYAHLHKPRGGRGYSISSKDVEACNKYAYQSLVSSHRDEFIKLIGRFWPIPNWPEWWRDRI